MALMLTLASNFIAVFTIPITLSWLLGKMTAHSIVLSPFVLLKNLLLTVLAPSIGAYTLKTLIPGSF